MKTVREKILAAAEENHWTTWLDTTAVIKLAKGARYVDVELSERGGVFAFSTEYQRLVGDGTLPRVLATLRGEELWPPSCTSR